MSSYLFHEVKKYGRMFKDVGHTTLCGQCQRRGGCRQELIGRQREIRLVRCPGCEERVVAARSQEKERLASMKSKAAARLGANARLVGR